jgi:hypothetical protein
MLPPPPRELSRDHKAKVLRERPRNAKFLKTIRWRPLSDIFDAVIFTSKMFSVTQSYDLVCKRGKKEFHVEVKGTTTSGDAVVLTNGEVKHAQDIQNACVLFIVHSIKLRMKKASGGKSVVMSPWRLKQVHLTPISFIYRLH